MQVQEGITNNECISKDKQNGAPVSAKKSKKLTSKIAPDGPKNNESAKKTKKPTSKIAPDESKNNQSARKSQKPSSKIAPNGSKNTESARKRKKSISKAAPESGRKRKRTEALIKTPRASPRSSSKKKKMKISKIPKGKSKKIPQSWRGASKIKAFDEIGKEGEYREPYVAAMEVLKTVDKDVIENFETRSKADFAGDNSLYHIPRMLSQEEWQLLLDGVRQRGRAMRHFFEDVHGIRNNEVGSSPGGGNMLASCVRAGVIPQRVIDRLLARTSETCLSALLRANCNDPYWSVWYGPDIIRGPHGKWWIVEDNLGFVGGFGDLVRARYVLQKHIPTLKPVIKQKPPGETLIKEMVKHYTDQIKADEKLVLLNYPNRQAVDNEDKRTAKLFRRYGVETIRHTINPPKNKPHLIVKPNGVYLVTPSKVPEEPAKEDRVGLTILNVEAYELDPSHRGVRCQAVLSDANLRILQYTNEAEKHRKKGEEQMSTPGRKGWAKRNFTKASGREKQVKKLKSSISSSMQITDVNKRYEKLSRCLKRDNPDWWKEDMESKTPGLWNAYCKGQVKISNMFGKDFLSDKELCPYVDKMISHYLNEEPLLKSIPTLSFGDEATGTLDEGLFKQVFDDPENQKDVVVKRVDGRGGDAVWVGAKISAEEFKECGEKVKTKPDSFLVQRYTTLSELNGYMVDIRALGLITGTKEEVLVSPVFWGRGVPTEGSNGKVNISDKGVEFAVCTAV